MQPSKPHKSDAELFWKLVEKQHGSVLAFALAKYSSSPHVNKGAKNNAPAKKHREQYFFWGICYVTDRGIFFYHFPKKTMFDGIFGSKPDEDFCVGLLFENIKTWKFHPAPKGFFKKLFTKYESGISVDGISHSYSLNKKFALDDSEDTQTSIFSTHNFIFDLNQDSVIHALRNFVSAKEKIYEGK